ncbi:MAG: ExbD/TolR family protein [bacterium]
MAMQLGGPGRGTRIRPMAEINVTPFVDVMLVLLIIFMVTAPLLNPGIEVELPETEAKAINDSGEPLAVTIMADGRIYVQDSQIEYDNLVPHLKAVAAAGYNQPIYIQGDKNASWDDVAKVAGRINAAGFRKLNMVTK